MWREPGANAVAWCFRQAVVCVGYARGGVGGSKGEAVECCGTAGLFGSELGSLGKLIII